MLYLHCLEFLMAVLHTLPPFRSVRWATASPPSSQYRSTGLKVLHDKLTKCLAVSVHDLRPHLTSAGPLSGELYRSSSRPGSIAMAPSTYPGCLSAALKLRLFFRL